MEYIELSTYYSDDGKKESTVLKSDDGYRVSVKTESGTRFVATFVSEEDAEAYAEDWVSK